jgi:hypothetical protein
MARIYTEYRVSHKSEEDKKRFEEAVRENAKKMGLNVTNYIRVVALNSKGEDKMEKLVKELKEEYLNKEVRLLDLDNDLTEKLNCKGIYEYDTRAMLENSFSYQVDDTDAVNFEMEITEDGDNDLDIVVKITDIYSL